MFENCTYSRFAYFDTNIISHLAKNKNLWRPLADFLNNNDLALGVSGAQIVELYDANRLHSEIVSLFLSVPSGLLKTWDILLDEEVKAYPHERKQSLLYLNLSTILAEQGGVENLQAFLSSKGISKTRKYQLKEAKWMIDEYNIKKDNFPPNKIGKYIRQQADEYEWIIVMQSLVPNYLHFLRKFEYNIKDFYPEVFKSQRLSALVIFYKYYLGQREPIKISDFGDLFHLAFIPYCELAIMERDLCEILNQIKKHQNILQSTIVRNIDFFKDWSLEN